MDQEPKHNPEELGLEDEPIWSEITSENLISSLLDVLEEEDIEFLREVDSFQAINYLFGVLPERGVEDPESLLKERGLLE